MNIGNSMQVCGQGAKKVGTLGGFFTFGGKDIFGISNNHVLANFNNCQVGDKICKAGSSIVVGTLQYWVKLNNASNYLDVALFRLSPGIDPYWNIKGSTSYPGNIREAIEGETVYMIKNNGSVKEGKISRRFLTEEITFMLSGSNYPFIGLIEIEALYDSPFSLEGESGSLIFSEEGDVLGLLVGTLVDGSKSYCIPFIHHTVGINAVYPLRVWQP